MTPLARAGSIAPLLLAWLLAAPVAHAADDIEALLQRGEVPRALELARIEVDSSPSDLDANELYIDLMIGVGMFREVERTYVARAAEAPDDLGAQYLAGRATRDPVSAAAAYGRVLERDPAHARAWMGMGAVHAAARRHAEAEAAYLSALRGDPRLSEAWLGLARARASQGQAAEALRTTKLGMAHTPSEPGLYLLAAALAPDDALAVLSDGARAAGGDARVMGALAEAQLGAGEHASALTSARAALELNPTLPQALRAEMLASEVVEDRLDGAALGALLEAQSLTPAVARGTCDHLVRAHPRSALALMVRAQVLAGIQQPDLAFADLTAAVEVDPDNAEAQAALGLLLLKHGRPGAARVPLGAARKARPWDASLGLALASAYGGAGDKTSQRAVLTELGSAHPFDVRVITAYAQALVDNGQAVDAYEVVREAARRIPDPQLGVALVTTATAAGRYGEAADIVEQLAATTGSASLKAAAARLRELEQGG